MRRIGGRVAFSRKITSVIDPLLKRFHLSPKYVAMAALTFVIAIGAAPNASAAPGPITGMVLHDSNADDVNGTNKSRFANFAL